MIYLGADHAGWGLKEELKKTLAEKGIAFEDLSPPEFDPKDDYPDVAFRVAEKVSSSNTKGILICGSGVGVSIAANKVRGVRAAKLSTLVEVIYGRRHNNLNILCLAGRTPLSTPERWDTEEWNNIAFRDTKVEEVWSLVEAFLHTPFEGGRHERRVEKIGRYEKE